MGDASEVGVDVDTSELSEVTDGTDATDMTGDATDMQADLKGYFGIAGEIPQEK